MIRTPGRIKTALALSACLLGPGVVHAANEELAQEVRESIQEEWDKDSPGENTIKELTLIQRGKNKYRGLVEVEGPDGPENLIVKVMVDDDNIIWEIVD